MTNPTTDQSLRERIALMLEWVKAEDHPDWGAPYHGSEFWVNPKASRSILGSKNHASVRKLPPWDTDNGLAIKVLREWCDGHGCWAMITLNENGCGIQIFGNKPDRVMSRTGHNDLATAICEAMLAACPATAEAKEGMDNG